MKTSFYFVLWICIYPLLDLLGIHSDNSFFIAMVLIFGLSYLLNRHMANLIGYDRTRQLVQTCELAYEGKDRKLRLRLVTMMVVEAVTVSYMTAMCAFLLYSAIHGSGTDYVILAIFLALTFGCGTRLYRLIQARRQLKDPQTLDEGMRTGFGVDYPAFVVERREVASPSQLLPPRPRRFPAYVAVNMIFAVLSALLGLVYLIMGIVFSFNSASGTSASLGISIFYLYGGLALYFGLRDIGTSLASLPQRP